MNASPRGVYPAVFALFLLSGATGLVYEVIWLRQLVLIFGSTQFATSTILSTFMGGLALGAFVAGRACSNRTIVPLRLYGLLEIWIGVYAVLVPYLFLALKPLYRALWNAGLSDYFVLFSIAKFIGIGLVLLIPTVLMGASLPILARQIADDPERIGGKVGGLYAINIFGAVAGTFIAGFIAIPMVGVQKAIWITAVVNVLIGLFAMALSRRAPAPEMTTPTAASPTTAASGNAESGAPTWSVNLALLVFGLSGFGALVLEVAWTRVLVLVVGSSVYAFALMLLAFLIGLAMGGACFSAVLRRRPKLLPGALLGALLVAAGLLAYSSAWLFQYLPQIVASMLISWDPGPLGWFVAQFIAGMVIMFPTTFALGGIFPTVLQMHARNLDQVAGSVGTVYAANTVGTIFGAAIAGFILIPYVGVLNTVIAVAALQILLGLVVLVTMALEDGKQRWLVGVPVVLVVVLLVAVRPSWNTMAMNSGVFGMIGDIEHDTTWKEYTEDAEDAIPLYEAEGLTAHVFVAAEPQYDNIYLSVNGKTEASTQSDLETQLLSAHLPLLVHPDPRDVMIIGLASGITAGSAATHPVENIRILEIEKKMIPAARFFEEQNGYVLDDKRVKMSINDARNELEFSSETYDVLISEPSNPWMTIAANLFTEEFFELAATRLRPGGIFCQWVQSYYLSTEDLRSVVAAFQSAFPSVLLFEMADGVDLMMLGSATPLTFDLNAIDFRMSELSVGMDLGRIEMATALDVLSTFRLGDREVRQLVRNAARNTDDNAKVEFSAPKSLGAETITPNANMLRQFGGDVVDYLDPPLPSAAEVDRFRLALGEILMLRSDYDLAVRSVKAVSPGPYRDRANELLVELNLISAGI